MQQGNKKLRRYNVGEVKRNLYYQLHKFLIHDPAYAEMTDGAKIAYALLRDRFRISKKNRWVDKDGDIFLIYSRADLQEALRKSEKTVIKIMSELRRFGLIEETRRGQGLPNLIYLLFPENPEIEPSEDDFRTVTDTGLNLTDVQLENCNLSGNKPVTSSVASYSNNELSENEERGKGGGAAKDPPPKKAYGEFGKVKLTDGERIALATDFGEAGTAAGITSMDTYCEGKGITYNNCYAMLRNWLTRDNKNPSPKPNRFANFKQRGTDYSQYEKLERKYIENKYLGDDSREND